jgi:anti-sigma regulatory factor (Ser/Thr protein kinase)
MTPHPERQATAGNTTAGADEPRDARQVMLPSALCAAGLARQQVRAALASWGLGQLEDTAVLLATELVGNAVRHARHGGNELTLRIADTRAWLRIDVSDKDPRPPQPHLPAELDESGFGLVLVEALAAKWGVDQATEGKTVWIELATGRAQVHELVRPRLALPHRVEIVGRIRDVQRPARQGCRRRLSRSHQLGNPVKVVIDAGDLAVSPQNGRHLHRPLLDVGLRLLSNVIQERLMAEQPAHLAHRGLNGRRGLAPVARRPEHVCQSAAGHPGVHNLGRRRDHLSVLFGVILLAIAAAGPSALVFWRYPQAPGRELARVQRIHEQARHVTRPSSSEPGATKLPETGETDTEG